MSYLGRQEQVLTKLVALQNPDGSFPLDDKLATIVGINIRALREESSTADWDEQAWATLVVLAYFLTRLGELHSDWKLLSAKSREWLAEFEEETVVESMFQRALSFFPEESS